MTRLLGAVLAGGRSSRFGSDKAMAPWQGRPLIEHAADALRPHVDALVVCGREHPGLASVPDRPAPGMGPLGGIAAALHRAGVGGFDAVLTIGCDTPLIPSELLTALLAAPGAAYAAGLPVMGRWPTILAAGLDAFLAQDRKHSIRSWAASVGAVELDFPDIPNINSPADLAALKMV